ncbi:cation:proton antiporter [Amycolatopsis samaneae]|uniref:Cation:proton antiporter n=1 Tax=Amycolatopsis samaneae TaxID=664691 RepID=A0ABW5GP92_9PSEU
MTLSILTAALTTAGVIGLLAAHHGALTQAVRDPLARFLLAAGAIVLLSHLLGALATRVGQPKVVGEILAGLLLCPSLLGQWWPELRHAVLTPDVVSSLDTIAQLGLVFFVYLLGADLDGAGLRNQRKAVGLVTTGSLLLPFAVGVLITVPAGPMLVSHPVSALFFGLALAITALPVLARILTELDLASTPTGALVLTSAAVGDAVAWLGLGAILVSAGIGRTADLLILVTATAALAVLSIVCVRPALAALAARAAGQGNRRGTVLPAVLVFGALAYAAATQALGLHPIIGAFVFGLLLPRHSPAVGAANEHLRGFTSVALLPLFFATVGLKTSFESFGTDPHAWLLLAVVLLAAMVTKVLGAAGGAMLGGLGRRQALRIGTLMNCRGVTELIVASIGLRLHLVNEFGYTLLVLVALMTTALAGPLLRIRALRTDPISDMRKI